MYLLKLILKTAEETKERIPILFNIVDDDSIIDKELIIHPILGLCHKDK